MEVNVRNKILYLIQAWAHAFRNEPKYKVVQDTYQIMKVEGESAGQCPPRVTQGGVRSGRAGTAPTNQPAVAQGVGIPKVRGSARLGTRAPAFPDFNPIGARLGEGGKQHTTRVGTESGGPRGASQRSLSMETRGAEPRPWSRGQGSWGTGEPVASSTWRPAVSAAFFLQDTSSQSSRRAMPCSLPRE